MPESYRGPFDGSPRDVYIGKFNSDYTAIESTYRITNTSQVDDATAYGWIEPDPQNISGDTLGTSSDTAVILSVDSGWVKLNSPHGGEIFHHGDTLTISWSEDGKKMTTAKGYLSLDAGKNWIELPNASMSRGNPTWGSFK